MDPTITLEYSPEPTHSPRLAMNKTRSGRSLLLSNSLGLSSDALNESRDKSSFEILEAPPIVRRPMHMVNTEALMALAEDESTQLKVLSYNVLAPRYITTEKYYHCPQWALSCQYRARGIADEILQYAPDFACLQELTKDMKESHLDSHMGFMYHCTPLIQILSRTSNSRQSGEKVLRTSMTDSSIEGVAIYYQYEKWEFVEHEVVPLDDIPCEGGRLYTPSSHNVSIVAVFRRITNPRQICVVSTVHLFYMWERVDVQIGQLRKIDKVIVNKKKQYTEANNQVHVVFVGDFNAEIPGATTSYVQSTMLDGKLRNAYTNVQRLYPTYVTAISQTFRGTIDHIWYDASTLQVAEALLTECGEQKVENSGNTTSGGGGGGSSSCSSSCCDDEGRLLIPTPSIPSDHFPVMATMRMVPHA
eukprot:PhF_6_TR33016/c3_g1_i1/m.48657/K12603/CNOT6, CCR4; CCR4-NOT transcription complex subunit 6